MVECIVTKTLDLLQIRQRQTGNKLGIKNIVFVQTVVQLSRPHYIPIANRCVIKKLNTTFRLHLGRLYVFVEIMCIRCNENRMLHYVYGVSFYPAFRYSGDRFCRVRVRNTVGIQIVGLVRDVGFNTEVRQAICPIAAWVKTGAT